MSSLSVSERSNYLPLNEVPSIGEGEIEDNEVWLDRIVRNGMETLLSSEVKRIAARVLGGLALAGAGVLVGLAVCSIVGIPIAIFSIPALLLAGYAFLSNAETDDYEDQEMVRRLREEAQQMSFDQIIARYGWEKIFEHQIISPNRFANLYRSHVLPMTIKEFIAFHEKVARYATAHNERTEYPYFIPHPQEQMRKWREETRSKTFDQIVEEYPMDRLESLGMVWHSEMSKIRELLAAYQAAKRVFNRQEDAAQAVYMDSTTEFRRPYEERVAELDRQFIQDPLKRELDGHENEKLRSKLRIENEFGDAFARAREEHESNISALDPNVEIVQRRKLSPEGQAAYDRLVERFFERERTLFAQKHERLRANEAAFLERRRVLEPQVQQLEASINAEKAEAKRLYDEHVGPAKTRKQEQLEPHLQRLNGVLTSLNDHYRSHIELIEARV